MTLKKHLRAQDIARQKQSPASKVDSAAAFMPQQDASFPDARISAASLYNQAKSRRWGIPQISIVMGPAPRSGAYVPAMSVREHHRAATRAPSYSAARRW